MPLVVGLGNPGARYAGTRHNVGWRVLETLAARWRAGTGEATASYRTVRATTDGREVTLLWPLRFMNASGEALLAFRETHPFEPSEMLVISDDVYLPVGALRLRVRGSSGGHQGLESIEAALGTRGYARLRIGIGPSPAPELHEHVLETFDDEEERIVTETIARAAEAAECWLVEGVRSAMNRFNRRLPKEALEP